METGRPAVTVQVGDEGALLEGGKAVVRVGRFGIHSEGRAHRHRRERRRMTAGQTFWDIDEAQPSGTSLVWASLQGSGFVLGVVFVNFFKCATL